MLEPKPMRPSAPFMKLVTSTSSVQPNRMSFSCFSFPFVSLTVTVSVANIPIAQSPLK